MSEIHMSEIHTARTVRAEQHWDGLIKKISDQQWRPVRVQSRCSL